MGSRAGTLLVATALLACAQVGCRENVYLGNHVARHEAGTDNAASAGDEADVAGDAFPAPVRGYLHTQGSKIYDEAGMEIRFKGVNWSGMQTDARVPAGLFVRTIDSLVAQVADLVLNLIRIPYSSASLANASRPVTPASDAGIGIS